jgi:hypothetical protein
MSLSIIKIFKANTFIVLLTVYVLSHFLVININIAEWGDSYRILRSALSIETQGDYPDDEKRPPLMAVVLALRPDSIDPLMWGRAVTFVIGFASFILFYILSKHFASQVFKKEDTHNTMSYYLVLVSVLYMFNPVLFYWSLRVMTDVLFLFFVLAVFTVYHTYPHKHLRYVLLGVLVGLSVLTRFEGYILGLSIGLGILIDLLRKKNVKEFLTNAVSFSVSSLVFVVPYLIYRNPFASSYLNEPQGRAYDLGMVVVFLASFLFMTGITGAFSAIFKNIQFFKRNHTLSIFLVLQTVLVLLWPAAVPRLFMPVIPFLVIVIASNFILVLSQKQRLHYAIVYILLTLIFAVSQYILRLQFLLVDKYVFITVLLIQGYIVLSLSLGKKLNFLTGVLLSCVIWSFATVKTHSAIYTTLVEASEYAVDSLEGDVLHNDTASIVEWNLNDLYPFDSVRGDFKPLDNDKEIDYNELIAEKKYEYLLVTNEERPYFEFKPDMKYLEEIYSSNEFVNGADFYTNIYKIKYE